MRFERSTWQCWATMALVVGLLAFHRAAQGDEETTSQLVTDPAVINKDVLVFLERRGIDNAASLKELHFHWWAGIDENIDVHLGDSAPYNPISVRAFRHPPLNKWAPTVTWPAAWASRATLLFADLGPYGCGTFGTWRDGCNVLYPITHGLWTECNSGSLKTCGTQIMNYLSPKNYLETPNRYIFILFRHDEPLNLLGAPATAHGRKFVRMNAASPDSLSPLELERLIRDNPGMTAVAYNYALVNCDGGISHCKI
jgi:hypothetical protein